MIINKILLTLKSIRNLHLFILDFLGLISKQDIVYHLRNGTSIIARSGSTDVNEVIIINGDLEYPKKHFPVSNAPIILDVGANIGAFSIYIEVATKDNHPLIYAIEPSKENFKYLNLNIRKNNLSNVKTYNIGLSNADGTANLSTSGDFDSFKLVTNSSENTETIETKTLQSFCEHESIQVIDLLKIDIEGAEYSLFENAYEFINQHVKRIFIELHEIDSENNINSFESKYIKNNLKMIDKIMNRTLIIDNDKFIV